MGFFKLNRTEAEKLQQQALKESKRVAKMQRKHAAKERKAQQIHLKQQQKVAKKALREAEKSQKEAAKIAKKVFKMRLRQDRKDEKERARAQAAVTDAVTAPPFAKSKGCSVCGKKFGRTPHRRRHHCRQCRKSCCIQCTSRIRRCVPVYGLGKPQKVCVVCETLVINDSETPREPAEAVAALAAGCSARATRRPRSAPLPSTTGVTVTMPPTREGRARSKSSLWSLPIRPLLKRKKSAQRLRNRKLDVDLQIEKRALFGGCTIELQPQAVALPVP